MTPSMRDEILSTGYRVESGRDQYLIGRSIVRMK